MEILDKLFSFQKYLRSIDQWNTQKTLPEIIADQQDEIRKQQAEIGTLKEDLKAARKLETQEYINIADGYLLSFLDICLQMQEAMLPDNTKELVFSQTQIVWCKMLAKYFREGNNEINLETIRRYFPADKNNPGSKYAKIPSELKLFQLKPARKRSWKPFKSNRTSFLLSQATIAWISAFCKLATACYKRCQFNHAKPRGHARDTFLFSFASWKSSTRKP